MKTALKISMLLNLSFLGCLLFIINANRPIALNPAPVIATEIVPRLKSLSEAATTSLRVETRPFRWEQLESDDYRVYVKNLRCIGCPEPTLRAIVTSDVDQAYNLRGQNLEQKLARLEQGSWSVQIKSINDQQALKAELQNLPEEAAAEIAGLLGIKPILSDNADRIAPTNSNLDRNRQNSQIAMPLVFQNVELSALNLNADQIQAIKDLRQSFLDAVGGSNQDPNDPAYRERWQRAQPEIDNQLRGMIGGTAFEDYQLAAADSH